MYNKLYLHNVYLSMSIISIYNEQASQPIYKYVKIIAEELKTATENNTQTFIRIP